jgi:hypothetical protein
MTGDPLTARAAMEGGGFYNRNSSLQAVGIRLALPLWKKTAAAVDVGEEPLLIVDYGSSQGRNSMVPIRAAIEAVRARAGSSKPTQVVHTDLPSNDFVSLFRALHDDPESYLVGTTDIFPAAIGRSYFEALLPPGQVHLGWNSWTLHWMSQKPVYVPDHALARLSGVAAVRAAAEERLADDWKRFLVARSSELRKGGKLMCLILIRVGERAGSDWLVSNLWDSVVDMGRRGLLSDREQLGITIPTGQRSITEIRAPFANGRRVAGLELEREEIVQVPDPFWDEFERTNNAEQLGRSWANTARAIFGPTIVGALDPGRDRGFSVGELFHRLALRIAASPRRNDYDLAAVVLGKVD